MAGDALIGRVLGSAYAIERKLGSGGMGAVYVARHQRTGRRYAVKVLLPEAASRPHALERFEREARVVGALGHAGIVAIHDFDRTPEGMPFIVMDLLEGEDLAARMARTGALPWEEAQRIFEEIASALTAAHAAGVIHRDLKPGNVFLAREPGAAERAKILDFGLAKLVDEAEGQKLTTTGAMLGTPLYMSPEQAQGAPSDHRADVYALGAILFEMLTGGPPFSGPHPTAVITRLLTEPPPLASQRARGLLPVGIDDAIVRALAKRPHERWPSVAALVEAVRGSAARGLVPATGAGAVTGEATHGAPPTGPASPGALRGYVSGPTSGGAPADAGRPSATVVGAGPELAATVASDAPRVVAPRPTRRISGPVVALALGGLLVAVLGLTVAGFYVLDPLARVDTRTSAAMSPIVPAPPPVFLPAQPAIQVPITLDAGPVTQVAVVEPEIDPDPLPAKRRARLGSRLDAGTAATNPAPAPPGPPADGPPAGVREAVARMSAGDYRGCVRVARAAPRSPEVDSAEINCLIQLGDVDDVERACGRFVARWPQHPFARTCPTLVTGLRAGAPRGP